MIARIGYALFRCGGAGVFALAVVYPFVAVVWTCLADGAAPADGWGFTERQLSLSGTTLKLALPAAGLGLLLALPVAGALGAARRAARQWLLWGLVICPLLLPPTVLAFGWTRLVAGLGWTPPGELLCVWSWASWLWPVPAVLLGTGWAAAGRAAYESALLDSGRWRAFATAALPALGGHLLAAAGIMLVLCCADYNVPHACNLQVYATELLAWATNYPAPVNVLWRSVPLVALLVLLALGVWACWRRWRAASSVTDMSLSPREVRGWPAWCVVLLLVAGPQIGLLSHLESPAAFSVLGRTYGLEITASLGLALAGGLIAILTGLAASTWNRLARLGAVLLLVVGFLPGALFGKALAAGYVHCPPVYDHWPILVFAYVGRFAWIGVLAGWLTRDAGTAELERTARLEGAGPEQVFWRVRVGLHWPVFVCAWLAAGGLCLSELPAASQVALPR